MLGDSLSPFFSSSLAATLERFALSPYGGNAVVEENGCRSEGSGVVLSAGKVDSRITEQRAHCRRPHVYRQIDSNNAIGGRTQSAEVSTGAAADVKNAASWEREKMLQQERLIEPCRRILVIIRCRPAVIAGCRRTLIFGRVHMRPDTSSE